MGNVKVDIPLHLEEQLFATLQDRINAVLGVADQVRTIIKDIAVLDGMDVSGAAMPQKQPRPRSNPTNEPNFPCLDTGDMLIADRWQIERTSDTERTVVFSPPKYFEHLISKAPSAGGRPFMTTDAINDLARQQIETEMKNAFFGVQHDPWSGQPLPEGYEVR